MELRDRFGQLQKETFEAVSDAAQAGLTEVISRLARIAKECEAAIHVLDNLEVDLTRLRADVHQSLKDGAPGNEVSVERQIADPDYVSSPRVRARDARRQWILRMRTEASLELRQTAEVKFRTPLGKKVGIPYASEREEAPDRWFLGLPDEPFDIVVLLCATDSGELLDFTLPPEFVSQIWRSLSRDTRKHVKFHVARNGVNYGLHLGGGVSRQINQFRGQLAPLR